MRFTLDQLTAFDRIVRLGGFHAASRNLGLSQPTVSQRIHELESAIGAKLFLRRGPRISLTAEGHALLSYTERMLGTAQEISERFRSRNPMKGLLRLGATDSFATVCLVELIRRLERLYPELQVSVSVENSRNLSRLLNDMELDVAVVSEPEVGSHVREERVGDNELAWVASTKLDVRRGTTAAKQLASMHLMMSPQPSRLYDTVMSWFAEAGFRPQRVSTCNNLSVIVLAIVEGAAVGVVPVRTLRQEIAQGLVRTVPVWPRLPPHRVSICYQASEAGGPIRALVDLIKEIIRDFALFTPEVGK